MRASREQSFRRANGVSLLFGVLLVGGAAGRAEAESSYLATFRLEYPAAVGSRIDACKLCHTAVPDLNPYGSAFLGANLQFAPIEALDSDGDHVPNLAEIDALKFPGDAADVPVLVSPTPTPTRAPATPTATPTASPTRTSTRTPGSGVCAGDCGGDGVVTVDELVRMVEIALDLASVDVCVSADLDTNGAVSIDEQLVVVQTALDGCS